MRGQKPVLNARGFSATTTKQLTNIHYNDNVMWVTPKRIKAKNVVIVGWQHKTRKDYWLVFPDESEKFCLLISVPGYAECAYPVEFNTLEELENWLQEKHGIFVMDDITIEPHTVGYYLGFPINVWKKG